MKTGPGLFGKMPVTQMGWGAVGFATAFAVLLMVVIALVLLRPVDALDGANTSAPNFGSLIALCGLASGMAGLVALIWKHERSWLVWLALLPGGVSIALLLRDLIFNLL